MSEQRGPILDYPTAWAIQREQDLEHHPKCSAHAGLLCDCGAVESAWRAMTQQPATATVPQFVPGQLVRRVDVPQAVGMFKKYHPHEPGHVIVEMHGNYIWISPADLWEPVEGQAGEQ